MSDYTVKKIPEMESIIPGPDGKLQLARGVGFVKVRAEVGASAFGIQAMVLPPNLTEGYPEHDHGDDGQEEVYAVLRGTGEMEIEGDTVEVDPDTVVRVASGTRRTVRSGPEGLTLLIVGAVPGRAYEPGPITEIGKTG